MAMTEIKLHEPAELNREDWRELQTLDRVALGTTLGRPQEDIDYLVQWNDAENFYRSHLDPTAEAGRRFLPNQLYTQLRVAVAYDGNDKVGFAYSAHNTSGPTEQIREAKRLSIVKNYLWLREFAVHPDVQRQGTARKMGQALLTEAIPVQPVAAYPWPDLVPFVPELLIRLGFKYTGKQEKNLFGEGKAMVTVARYQARFAAAVLAKLSR